MTSPRILVFDSGLGGLTVFRAVVAARPDASYIYAADDAFFPYGARGDEELTQRVIEMIGALIGEHAPDLVVVACNTASTIALPALRATFTVPFVGTVPAVKPACAMSRSRLVSVLGTEATVRREYTQALIREFGQGCDVNLVGSTRLAELAEAMLRGEPLDNEAISHEIAPCFVARGGARTDVVVMACTHYPLLLSQFRELSPWEVTWLDPAEAIARRVVDLLGPPDLARCGDSSFSFSSRRTLSEALAGALAEIGINASASTTRDT